MADRRLRHRRGTIARRVAAALLLGVVVAAIAIAWAGHALTRAAPTPAPAPPPDPTLQRLVFPSASGASISAWFVRGDPRAGAVLLLHGIRSGKTSMLARARFLHALGFSVMMIDLQAHGESTGERITFGFREALDVDAALKQLAQLAPAERIGVLGRSLGAAAAVFSDARRHYSAVVLESLYPTIEEAAQARLRLRLGPPGAWLAPLLLMQLEPVLGVHRAQLRPIDHVGGITAPVLVVHGSADRHTPLAQAQRLFDAIEAPKALWVVEAGSHPDLHAHAGRAYEARVGAFFVAHLRALTEAPTLLSRIE